MQIDSADKLIHALRASGLFTAEQMLVLIQDLAPLRDDVPGLCRRLVQKNRITEYQLRKVMRGKAAELFIGPYVISYRIGEGGMGRVYRAVQTRMGREVALKVVRDNLLTNPIVRKRYDREVETASALNHPNVVAVYDAGEVDGRYYLAMEFVDGVDLSRLNKEFRPLQIAEACEYVRQAALGLHYAHEQGLVHRDVKPSNIIVAGERHIPEATEPAIVKILDLGLVRTVGFDDGGGGGDLTRAGTVVGTPDYMAPEQAKNSSGVDHRADIYSLGCTLYFLLSGQPPFPTGTPIEKLLKHQLDAPTPLQALRPEVPTRVAEVVAMLMAKHPDDRLQTAAEVAEVLAPLAQNLRCSPPVALSQKHKRAYRGPQEQSPSGPEVGPIAPVTQSTLQPAQTEPGADPTVPPVAPSDHTPRPVALPPALHASGESPFIAIADSDPADRTPQTPVEVKRSPTPRSNQTWLWIAAGVAIVVVSAIAAWLAFSGRKRPVESPAPESVGAAPAESRAPPVRPGITPAINAARFQPRLDLIMNDPALVVVSYPATYLRVHDSPYSIGAGPSKLESWVDRLRAASGLPMYRSERVIYSTASGPAHRFLLVSEGDYLTPSFPGSLATISSLRPGKQAARGAVREFTGPANLQTAFISPAAGSPVYALATDAPLINSLVERLVAPEKTPVRPKIDSGILGAINTLSSEPPIVFAVAGPSFTFPFTFQSVDKDYLTLRDFGVDLLVFRLRIPQRMELELEISGESEQKIQELLEWAVKKLRDEFPQSSGELVAAVRRATRSVEQIDGKPRVTLRATVTPEQWSGFLERILTG
jgi:serine/threonine-protein kinase